jgi:hypothetical protein
MSTPKPIGYWLKHLDNLLETQFDLALADLSVNRRQWQLLNTLSRGSRTHDELKEALAPFWTDGEPDPREPLADLAVRGWTQDDGGTIILTGQGKAAHAKLAARIETTRAMVLGDLTPEQYSDTVRILSVMAANVEADLRSRGYRG